MRSPADFDQNVGVNDASLSASDQRKTTNKRLSTHLKLVVDNSGSLLPVSSGDQ